MWTKKYTNCIECNRNSIPHKAFGLCKTCYEAKKKYKWQKAYYRNNKEKVNVKRRLWAKANPDKIGKYHITKIWMERISKRDGIKCKKCGTKENLTLQHKIPKCIGGKYAYNNLEILCYKCNREHWDNLVKKALQLYFKKKGLMI